MIKVCKFDGVEFEAKRSTAKFCSDNCRVKAAQKAGVDANGEVLLTHTFLGGIIGAQPAEKVYDREANLAAFIKMGVPQVDWVSTGIPDFDELTQIPRGRLTQIEGRYGVGKTTLCLNMIKGLRDRKVLYIDSEASLNPELLVSLELEAKNFNLYNESAYLEEIIPVLKDAIRAKTYDMIVLDSLAMTTTKTIDESSVTAANIGQKAKIFNKFLETIMGDLRDSRTALVIINQTRDGIDPYKPPTYTPGGSGKEFNASLMISLKTIKSWRFPKDPKDHIYLGHEIEATIIKSKVNTPWRVKKFKLYYPQPIVDNLEAELADNKPLERLAKDPF